MISPLTIEGLPLGADELSRHVVSMQLSWTLDAVAQITFDVLDRNKQMLLGNYFQVRRGVNYAGDPEFEIATHEIHPSSGGDIQHRIEARRRALQLMKRDKDPEGFSGITGTDYARQVAERFGLHFVGEPTTTKRAIVQSTQAGTKESVWDVLARTASEAKFVVFEADKTLYFASEKWLLGKWANIQMTYPSPVGDPYQILEVPTCRRSDNAESDIDFTLSLAWQNAAFIRPGMTVKLNGLGEFDVNYLVTEVSFEDGDGQPINISGRTPAKVDE